MEQVTVICTYRVASGREDEFLDLLNRHWLTLHSLGVVTADPAQTYRSLDTPTTVVEIFTWLDGGFARAREHPDVLAIWEPMEMLCEARNGSPAVEFPHFEALSLQG